MMTMRVALAAHEACLNGLEAANSHRATIDELRATNAELKARLDRVERTSEKAAIVRLAARGGGA